MSLFLVDAPVIGLEIIRKHVAPMFNPTVDADLRVARPHPVYIASGDDIRHRRLLVAARQRAWQYLIIREETVRASATLVSSIGRTDELRYGGLRWGGYADFIISAISAADELPDVLAAPFELRILRVPSLYLFALWLAHSEKDILMPVSPTVASLEANRAYSEDELVRALLLFAVQRLDSVGR